MKFFFIKNSTIANLIGSQNMKQSQQQQQVQKYDSELISDDSNSFKASHLINRFNQIDSYKISPTLSKKSNLSLNDSVSARIVKDQIPVFDSHKFRLITNNDAQSRDQNFENYQIMNNYEHGSVSTYLNKFISVRQVTS